MAGDFTELLHQNFSDLESAVKSWRRLSEKCLHAGTESGRTVSGPLHKAGWEGASARRGFEALEAVESMLGTAHTNIQLVASVLDTVNERMQSAQRKLRKAVTDAESAGHHVTGNGTVKPIPASVAAGGAMPHRFTVEDANSGLAEFQDRINKALQQARTASNEGAQALMQTDTFELDKRYGGKEAERDARLVADLMGIDVQDIPEGGDPRRNAEWWHRLGKDEQRVYLAAFPERIGWLDGLPAEVRDQANRTVLETRLNHLSMRADNGSIGMHDGFSLDAMSQLKKRLDTGGTAPSDKRLFLLGIDPEKGQGRAVVAVGNPDRADHTAVLVPGTGTDLSKMSGQIDRISMMQDAANARARGESVSVISWLGYDAPEINDSVASTGRAEEAAPDLRHFTEGTRVAQGDHRSHLTVVGHSYGSTAVGTAASGGNGLGADDIVALGSPGMNVGSASELQVDPRHVWVGAAGDDPVVRHLSNLTLGGNPGAEGFGAQPMAVNEGGHSSYWDADPGPDTPRESLKNQGRVIAGERPRLGEHFVHDVQVNPVGPDGDNLLVIG